MKLRFENGRLVDRDEYIYPYLGEKSCNYDDHIEKCPHQRSKFECHLCTFQFWDPSYPKQYTKKILKDGMLHLYRETKCTTCSQLYLIELSPKTN